MGSGAQIRLIFRTYPTSTVPRPFGSLNANICISPNFSEVKTVTESEPFVYGLKGANRGEYGVGDAALPPAPFLPSTTREQEHRERGEDVGMVVTVLFVLFTFGPTECIGHVLVSSCIALHSWPSAVFLLLVVRYSCLIFFNDRR